MPISRVLLVSMACNSVALLVLGLLVGLMIAKGMASPEPARYEFVVMTSPGQASVKQLWVMDRQTGKPVRSVSWGEVGK